MRVNVSLHRLTDTDPFLPLGSIPSTAIDVQIDRQERLTNRFVHVGIFALHQASWVTSARPPDLNFNHLQDERPLFGTDIVTAKRNLRLLTDWSIREKFAAKFRDLGARNTEFVVQDRIAVKHSRRPSNSDTPICPHRNVIIWANARTDRIPTLARDSDRFVRSTLGQYAG